MSDDKITITLKADGAPWIVIHADSLEEADQLLEGVGALQQKAIDAAVSFKSAGSHLAPARGSGGGGGGRPAYGNSAPPQVQAGQVELRIPFGDPAKDAVKAQGARWNGVNKTWIVSEAVAQQFPQFRS